MGKLEDDLKPIFAELELLKHSNKFNDLKRIRRLQKEIDDMLDLEQPTKESDADLDEIWERSRRGG